MKKSKVNSEESEMKTGVADNVAESEVKSDATTANSAGAPNEANADTPTANAEAEAALNMQIAELKDKYLRLSAEFDNYRRRTLKEKMDMSKYAGEEFIKGLLPVVDDFERGLKNLDQAKDMDAVKDGIGLIYNKFREFLSQKGVKEIDIPNNAFDTDFHEAITKIPVEDTSLSGKVVDVVQKGYILDEKVIRHSKVVVGA